VVAEAVLLFNLITRGIKYVERIITKSVYMKKAFNFLVIAILTSLCGILGCRSNGAQAGMDQEEREGATIKTFYNEKGNIEVVVITDKGATITAIPFAEMARQRKMSDEEFNCLKKCKNQDGTYSMGCVLLCPITKLYKISASS
jgi:hypothetical protein